MIFSLIIAGLAIIANGLDITTTKNPIIFVPGLGGTCLYNTNKNQIWPPSLNEILYSNLDLNENYQIDDNLIPKVTSEISKYLDLKNIKIINKELRYFTKKRFGENLLNSLVVDGFPTYSFGYDFRVVPNSKHLDKLFEHFQNSIEEIYKKNSKKVVIIAHSLGSLLINHFFNQRSSKWNLNYIDKVIFINPPISGSVCTLYLAVSDTINIFFKKINVKFIRKFGGFEWCLPKFKQNILNVDGVDCDINSIYPIKNNMEKFRIKHNVKSHLILSNGIKTPIKIYLKKDGSKYKFIKYDYGDGDGVIFPLNEQDIKQFNFIHRLQGDHSDILDSRNFFEKICSIVQ
jgi:hypothetical protein